MNVKSLSLKLDPRTHDDDSNGDDYEHDENVDKLISYNYHQGKLLSSSTLPEYY